MKKTIVNRAFAVLLCLTLIATLIPSGLFKMTAQAAVSDSFWRASDNESIDYWKGYFSDGSHSSVWSNTVSTQNAGAVWTDKSVFLPAQNGITIDGVNVPLNDTGDNFLISMSVMAANKTVKGYEYIPTSTMLVLDVSGSMGNGNGGNRTWDEMIQAANKAIDTLINLNNNNRVGVVLYSGNTSFGDSDIDHSTLLLPLDRYSTTAVNNNGTENNTADDYAEYLTAYNSTVGINSAVKLANGGNVNTQTSKSVTGGTYIQGGIYRAMEELVSDNAPKKVADGVQAGMAYTPIIVLMSDGAPTAANLDYSFSAANGNHETDIGDGGSTDERMGFLTQLTAAYAKSRVDEVYEKSALFYTLGLGLNSLTDTQESIAESVLNPSSNTGNINGYWNTYLGLADNATMYLNRRNNGTGYNAVVKSNYITSSYKNYVTQYFEAVQSQNTTLEQALLNSFQQIVDAIVIQSVYYPTEIGDGNADLGGYVTFRDELGEYMDIKSVKGLLFEDENGNQVLHTGALLAKNFVAGGGDLGQSSNPKPLGEELVNSVKARLGIEDTVTAQNLIRNAYNYKQLYYDESNDTFSNYIGWYGDAEGKFVDFWHEGQTATEQQAAITKGAKFIYKSYGYLGEVNTDLGVKASDMMYTSIRVRKTIAEGVAGTAVGEIVVEGSIPASLIPTITYEIKLNGKTYESGVQSVSITDTSATHPARLLYEVGLRDDINPINIAKKVNASHKNADGTYTFYTNDWEVVDYENHEIADTSVNAFTHFEPSGENERYYYLTDSTVYSDANGTVYTGTAKPSGDGYYHEQRVFSVTNGQSSSEVVYVKTSADSLSHAVKSGNQWVIPAGTGKHEIVGYEVFLKNDNTKTQTNRFSAYPRIKADTENSNRHAYHYAVVTFGNNGKLVVTPATGIKIAKALDVASDTAETFEFTVSGAVANESYILTPVAADGSFGIATTVRANASGVITVDVKAGEAVYITGLAVGNYTVTESEHDDYRVLSINGQSVSVNSTTVQVEDQKTTEVNFVNTLKGFGNLYITKEVVGVQAVPQHALNEEFEITVNVGASLAGETFDATHSKDATLQTVTVNSSGYITGLKLRHGETVVIRNLPENTTATVSEGLTAAQADNYTVKYSSHNKAGDTMDNDGVVTVVKDANATVIVENTYKPKAASVAINIEGEKAMDATHLLTDKTFEFTLEKYENGNWTPVSNTNATATVTAGSNVSVPIDYSGFGDLTLDFDNVGVHSYRIYEVKPTTPDAITYDPAIYNFVVTVTDNNGQLEAAVTGHAVSETNNGYTVDADFTNAYNTASVILDVNKVVTNTTIDNPSRAGYEFELYKVEAGGRNFVDAEVTGKNGATRFAWVVDSSDIGTHNYVIKEKTPAGYTEPTSADSYGWHYDTAERNITVVVSEENGDITVKIDNLPINEAGQYTFNNEYKAKKATLSLENIATKTLIGRNLSANEFEFNLTKDDGTLLAIGKNGAATDGNPAAIKFYKTDGNNNATNQEYVLEYEKVGTYHYKISEVTGNLGGVDYTTRIFDLVVDVTDDGNGNLTAAHYFEDSTYLTANFVNTYAVKTPTSIELHAVKKLSGDRLMLSSEFHFNVYEMTDGQFNVKKYENAIATGANVGAEAGADGIAEAVFDFSEITYTQPGTYYYQISEEKGTNEFGIKYDDTVYNVTVTVTDNLDGTMTARADKTTAELVFNNTYTPRPINYNFVADKVLTGRTLINGEFEFALYKATVQNVGGNDEWIIGKQVGQNVKNAANGDIAFPNVEFTQKGEYYYIAKEVSGNLGGITYDDTEYHITFTVTDDHKGTLSVDTVIVDGEGNPSQIVFNNGYAAENTEIVIEATKTLLGRDMKAGEFEFVIKEGDTIVAEGTNKAADAGVAADIVFEKIEYTMDDIGEHTYTVEEVVPEGAFKDGITFDENVFTVKVTVTDNGDGTLSAATDKTKDQIEFTNGYSAAGTEIDLSHNAKKTLEGRVMNNGEFTFELYKATYTAADGWAIGEKIQSVNSDADGKFTFNKITYNTDGTYRYVVKEHKGDKGGVIYDETVYYITVEVKDNLLGNLKANVKIEKADGQTVSELIFNNSYEAAETGVAISGKKTLEGATLVDKQFSFLLYAADDNFNAVGSAIQTVSNTADGSVVFQNLKFTKAGTYKYIIVENNDKAANYIYDDTVWCVTVVVTDDFEGKLVAQKTVTKKGDAKAETVFEFHNQYVPPKTPQTGDTTNISLWLTLFLASGVGLFATVFYGKKKREK